MQEKKSFRQRYSEIVNSDEHKLLLKKNKFQNKLLLKYMAIFIPIAVTIALIIQSLYSFEYEWPILILGFFAIFMAKTFALLKTEKNFKNLRDDKE